MTALNLGVVFLFVSDTMWSTKVLIHVNTGLAGVGTRLDLKIMTVGVFIGLGIAMMNENNWSCGWSF